MAENLTIGQTVQYEVVWFDGPSGTGNVIADPGQGTFVSDNPNIVQVQVTGSQTVAVIGEAAGSANVQATSSTGVNAGFLDESSGAYTSGPLAFVVAAAAQIVSGILRRIATPLGAKTG